MEKGTKSETQEEMMMQRTREAFEKEKATVKAGENLFQGEGVESKSATGYAAEDNVTITGLKAEAEIPTLDGLLESVFGGAEVHIDTVNIHIGDHMESVNFMGDTEVETEMEETEEVVDEEPAEGSGQVDNGGCCGAFSDAGCEDLHPIYVDTDLMEKVVAVVTGTDRKTVAAVLKGIAMYLRVLAEDAENKEGNNGR